MASALNVLKAEMKAGRREDEIARGSGMQEQSFPVTLHNCYAKRDVISSIAGIYRFCFCLVSEARSIVSSS